MCVLCGLFRFEYWNSTINWNNIVMCVLCGFKWWQGSWNIELERKSQWNYSIVSSCGLRNNHILKHWNTKILIYWLVFLWNSIRSYINLNGRSGSLHPFVREHLSIKKESRIPVKLQDLAQPPLEAYKTAATV